MKTIITSETKVVTIDTEGPFTIIGEKINPTGRKKLAAQLKERNYDYVRGLVLKQIEAGADILDVNVGVPGEDEVVLLPEVCKIIMDATDVPLCIDSANREALAAALAVVPGKPLVNSVNGEEASLEAVLPVIKEFGAAVIALTMDNDGIPGDPEKRLSIAEKILERAAKIGIPAEDVVIDPLVLTIGADSKAGWVTLQTIEMVREALGVNVNLGASNVSFGLPERHTINQAFLGLAIAAGATCAITDPMKLSLTIRAVDLLRGRDDYAGRYIKHYRKLAAEIES
ncbi:MAG: dihydropteroate synthase [Anaerolineales bacterium]|nr:dihydropteroate synthase [Anaerolineales bacterium]